MKPNDQEGVLVISRTFQAPIQAVFNALAQPDALSEWWGPSGYVMTVTRFDFKPRGLCLFKMENESGIMWARFIYGTIQSPERVEFILSFSDENGGLTRAPFFDHWPMEILNVITLSEQHGLTTLTNTCSPVRSSPEELASFSVNSSSFHQGFNASLDKLYVILDRI